MPKPGDRVDFVEESNPWSVFVLEDGTRMRLRLVLKAVFATNRKLPDGQLEFNISFQPVIDQAEPDRTAVRSRLIKDT